MYTSWTCAWPTMGPPQLSAPAYIPVPWEVTSKFLVWGLGYEHILFWVCTYEPKNQQTNKQTNKQRKTKKEVTNSLTFPNWRIHFFERRLLVYILLFLTTQVRQHCHQQFASILATPETWRTTYGNSLHWQSWHISCIWWKGFKRITSLSFTVSWL